MYTPNSKAEVQPTPLIFPSPGWNGVQTQQYVANTHFNVLRAAYQGCSCR